VAAIERAVQTTRQRAEQESKPPPTIRDSDFAPELAIIPPGKFMMGSTELERRWAIGQGAERELVDPENSQHRVQIAEPFAIGKYNVTRGQFVAFVEATAHDMSGGCWLHTGSNWKKCSSADWCSPPDSSKPITIPWCASAGRMPRPT
jgi:formylglycine-generating enzyme required for sulfatase activity